MHGRAQGDRPTRCRRSRREIPEATVWVDVDATELVEARAAINAAAARGAGEPARAAGPVRRAGLRRYPELNARIDGATKSSLLDAVNLGFAAQTERGLVVPVVPDAQELTTAPARRRARPASPAGPRRARHPGRADRRHLHA